MKKIAVTAIVMTKNEELVIGRTISSLDLVDQVLVVDSGSTDGTVDIATKLGADVVQFKWDGGYPKKKQWSLDHHAVRNRWVIFVDADEFLSTELAAELGKLDLASVSKSGVVAFDAGIDYYFSGRRLRFGHRVTKRILLDRENCHFPVVDDLRVRRMWEVEGHYQPIANGRVSKFEKTLEHKDDDSLYDYFARHNRYSDWEAHLRSNPRAASQVRKTRTRGGRLFDRAPIKPIVFFVWCYIVKRGFLDGRAGFDYALFLTFYYWQIGLKYRRRDF